ncbi:MAG TPA: SRPBCC family protein [Micromonosporaceae bacterium]
MKAAGFSALGIEATPAHEGDGNTRRMARGLGWFSLGLGVAALAAPRGVSRLAGIDGSASTSTVVRLVGARELVQGAGLLSGRRPSGWVWSRVAGDVLDLSALALATRQATSPLRAGLAGTAVAGITAVDVLTATRTRSNRAVRVERAVTVNRTPAEVYAYYRDFSNLPRFMTHLERVDMLGNGRSHWVAKAPLRHVEWDAEITEEVPDQVIGWRALEHAGVPNAGQVSFAPAPGGRGTEVRVSLTYRPPAGAAGVALARLVGEDPDQQVREDLRHLKQVLECGEVIKVDERVSARGPVQRRATRLLRRRLATGGRP